MNAILCYPGCFNPFHNDHTAVILQSVCKMKEHNLACEKVYIFLAPTYQTEKKTKGDFSLSAIQRKRMIELTLEQQVGLSFEVVMVPEDAVTADFYDSFVANSKKQGRFVVHVCGLEYLRDVVNETDEKRASLTILRNDR